ncbi:hypothetical protein OXPF_03290 [Oxobacter pfennigii]|uniref:Uncharacterized protein n=1 Tax=Oxobacter pfennigii TaxID=36849 RepID=A0A0P8Z153_9CLOT|nr:hypothetical protein [Oxobacter pfennigii]KPU45861.1 hypothetical protein OXPF_03290 [Oxobacter pfennigii]
MIFPGLKKWAKLKGWQLDKNFVYGNYNGYIFTAFDGRNYKVFTTMIPNLTEEQKEKIFSFIKENKKRLKISEYSIESNVLTVKYKELIRPMKIQEMDAILKALTDFFLSEGIYGKEHCAICGAQGNHDTVAINDSIVSLCGTCYRQSIDDVEEMSKEYATEEKNYAIGFIGALLGGLVGVIPWVIVENYLGLYASILGFLIGKASLKGYTLFKGKIGKPTGFIIGAATTFSVIAAELVSLAILMIQEGAYVSLENYIISFTHPEIAGWVYRDLGLGLLMAFLGISSIFRQLKDDVDTVVPRIRKVSL